MTGSRSLPQHPSRGVLDQVLFLLAGLALLAFVGWLQGELDQRQDRTAAQMETLAQLPRGEVLKPALLGYHHLGADLLWLRFLQVLGKKRNSAEEYEWIYHALDVITTLDPQYDYAYYVGGVVLSNLADRVDLSNRLLDKGFTANPTVWNIPFLLGYNHYFILGDAAKAADYIAAAARLPGSPSYLPGLATRMYAEASNPDTALQFLEALWRQTHDAEIRDALEKRAKEVMIERDIRALESAIQKYRSQQGQFPQNLQDLVISKTLSPLPQEPFNGEYRLDTTTGTITSSTHPKRLKTFHTRQQPRYVFPKVWEYAMHPEMDVVVQTEELCKSFRVGFWGRKVTVVDHLALEVRRGEVFGFLGPNGAGKTTTLKMLMGLIYPTSGTASIFGYPIGAPEAKAMLGFLPESPYFYDYLTGGEFLRFYGHLFGLWGTALEKRVDALLDRVGMIQVKDLQLRKFSKGMLQRVGVAQALINDPELVVLDEPMSGLDPIGRKEVRDLILHLKESGKTVLFSSHILHDAEMLCDRVAMIMKGKVVACGQVSELLAGSTTQEVEMVIDRLLPEALERIRPLAGKVVLQGERVMVVLTSQQGVDQALDVIRSFKAKLVALTPHRASLEDLFIREANGIQSAKEATVS